MPDDLIARLREEAALWQEPSAPIDHRLLLDAANVIERLRRAYLRECEEMGYDRDEAEEMLAHVESDEGEEHA